MAKTKETETLELTAKQVREDFEDVYNEIFEAGRAEGSKEAAKAEKERFEALKKACGEDTALLTDCYAGGLTTAEAQAKRIEKLNAKLAENEKQIAELTANPPNKQTIDPAVTEFNNQPESVGGAEKFNEEEATEEQLKEHFTKTKDLQDQFSSPEAYIAAVRHPAKR